MPKETIENSVKDTHDGLEITKNISLPEYLQEMDQLLDTQIKRLDRMIGVNVRLHIESEHFESVRRETVEIQETFLRSQHFLDKDTALIHRHRASLEKIKTSIEKLSANSEKIPCLDAIDNLMQCLNQLEAPISCMNKFKQEMQIYLADIQMDIKENTSLNERQASHLTELLGRISTTIQNLTCVTEIITVKSHLDVLLEMASSKMDNLFPSGSSKMSKQQALDTIFVHKNKESVTFDGKKMVVDLKKIVKKLPQDLMNDDNESEQRDALLERPVDADSFKNRSDSLSSYTSSEASTEASSEKRLSDNDFQA